MEFENWSKTNGGFFRKDHAYAGIDHEIPSRIICTAPFIDPDVKTIISGFKTVESAMKKADELWPIIED